MKPLRAAQRLRLGAILLLRHLPLRWVSAIGAWLGERNARDAIAARRLWVDRLHRNFQQLGGLDDPRQRERAIVAHRRALGTAHVEFTVLQRLVAAGRVEVQGVEQLEALAQPVIIAGAHLANWELLGHVLERLGRPAAGIIAPPDDVVERTVAARARRGWNVDLALFPADSPLAARRVVEALHAGRNLLLFVDEEAQGYIRAPRLGREVPLLGNLSIAARLAARHGCPIVPAHVVALGRARYRIVVEPPLDAGEGGFAQRAEHLAEQLDATLSRWVRADLEHWYWLAQYEQQRQPPR